jgi:hypothetical protein
MHVDKGDLNTLDMHFHNLHAEGVGIKVKSFKQLIVTDSACPNNLGSALHNFSNEHS